jgi:hypothetical protein
VWSFSTILSKEQQPAHIRIELCDPNPALFTTMANPRSATRKGATGIAAEWSHSCQACGVETTADAPSTAAGSPKYSELISALSAVAVGAIVLIRNWGLVGSAIVEDGDSAANSLLIDRAKHLTLLTGNYSRVGFHHPGPALLWIQAAGEVIFRDVLHLVSSPYNGHVLSIILLEVGMIWLSTRIASRWFRTASASGAFAIGLFAVVSLHDGVQSSTWMPHIYIWPFLLFTVAAISLMNGQMSSLPEFALSAVLLIHGHISFLANVTVVVVTIAAVTTWRWRRKRSRLSLPSRAKVWLTVVIVVVGAAPLLINLVVRFPGDWADYWRFAHSGASPNPLKGSVRLLLSVWNIGPRRGALAGALALAGLLLLTGRSATASRRLLTSALATYSIISASVLFYAVRGVDDLRLTYVVIYFVAVPMTAVGLVLGSAVECIGPLRLPTTGLLVAGAVIFGSTARSLNNPYRGSPSLPPALAAAVSFDSARHPQTTGLVLRFETPGWPAALGLIEQARREGNQVCVENPVWAFLVTSEEICTPHEIRTGLTVQISGPDKNRAPSTSTIFQNPDMAIDQVF